MADILKALPFLTVEEYLWGLSASFIRLMAYDQSRVRYLSQKQVEKRKRQREAERQRVFTADDVFRHLGLAATEIKADEAAGADWKQMLMAQQKKNENQEPKNEQ